MTNDYWYIVYRSKHSDEVLESNLKNQEIEYYLPKSFEDVYDGKALVEKESVAIRNLVFVKTDDVTELSARIVGLKKPYKDCSTGKPAKVRDVELQKFKTFLNIRPQSLMLLNDTFDKFSEKPMVRVKAGPYQGIIGRLVRIQKKRQLVISLDKKAILVSGLDYSLFELLESKLQS